MNQAANIQTGFAVQELQTARTQAKATSRLAYIDSIRIVLTTLVIVFHAAIAFGALGDWTYIDPAQDELTSILLSFFVIGCQSFFMGLFFFYAGYFTPGAVDRKGLGQYWKDRLLRLAIPLLIYTFLLSRIPNYINMAAHYPQGLSFWEFSRQTFLTEADEGPTWFLFALLIFAAGYTLWRLGSHWLGSKNDWAARLPAPGIKAMLAFALLMSAGMFTITQIIPLPQTLDVFGVFSLILAFFPQYILMFTAGILAYRSGWLFQLDGKTLRFWSVMSVCLALALPVLMLLGGAASGHLEEFMTGLNWRCVVFNLWIGLACVAFSATLTLWLRRKVQPQNRMAAFAGPNTFAAYLIHPLILVPVTHLLSFTAIPPLLKWGIAGAITVPICFLLAEGLRRLPGARKIL